MVLRPVAQVIDALRTTEGAGFPVRRPFPIPALDHVDPFLLLDEMGPVDYLPGQAVGAPHHPHRGFETVTYLLEGEFQHEDSAGHRGRLGPGDVQWMTAGRGVVHDERPSDRIVREGGRVHGFQIWVNLPKADKMMAPRYQEIPEPSLPTASADGGKVTVRILAGTALGESAVIDTRTPIVLQHWTLRPGGGVDLPLDPALAAYVYVFAGSGELGDRTRVDDGQLAVLGEGDTVRLTAPASAPEPLQALLLAGRPLNEPVARWGPFVMNTEGELRQAMLDYRAGRLG